MPLKISPVLSVSGSFIAMFLYAQSLVITPYQASRYFKRIGIARCIRFLGLPLQNTTNQVVYNNRNTFNASPFWRVEVHHQGVGELSHRPKGSILASLSQILVVVCDPRHPGLTSTSPASASIVTWCSPCASVSSPTRTPVRLDDVSIATPG